MRYPLKIIMVLCFMMLTVGSLCAQGDDPGMPPQPVAPEAAPVMSDDGSASQTPTPEEQPTEERGRSRRRRGGGEFSMNFERADVQSVLKFFSMSCRIPVVIDPDLKGNVTILCRNRLSLPEMYEVINASLHVRGFAMQGGLESKVIRVVPLKKAITGTTTVIPGKEPGPGAQDSDMVTQVIPLDYAASDKLRDELRPLVSADQASIVSISTTNTLIITDNAANVRRLMEIIGYLDKDTFGAIEVEVYQCRYANAEGLVTTLNALFQPARTAGQAAIPAFPMPFGGGRGGRGGGQQPTPVPSGGGLAGLKDQVSFTSEVRTNRLIISGTRSRIDAVLEVVKELDVDTEPEVKVRFFGLQYADATAVAEQLNSLFEQPQQARIGAGQGGGGRGGGGFPFFGGGPGGAGQQPQTASAYPGIKRNAVAADVRTNSVIVTGTEQNIRAFESMIKELDAPKVLSEVTRVYHLKYARSADLADSLNRLFRGDSRTTGGGGRNQGQFGIGSILGLGGATQNNTGPLAQLRNITVVSEPKTNSLLVTGPPNSANLLSDLIAQLDKRTAQVFIEVAIVDVTLDKNTKFGVEWQWNDITGPANDPVAHDVSTDFGLSRETTGLKYSVLSNNLDVLLHALKTRSNVKVLSTPTITTADNVEASISIGRDEPFVSSEVETTGGSFRRTVDFKKVAVALTVTPHVNEASDVIALDVHQTINEIIGREPEFNAPIIADREALTSISVRDGQTIVIGGIIKENKERITRGIPILSDIPIIGELFKTRDNRIMQSELMVFLTPHILKTDDDVTKVTDQVRSRLTVGAPDGLVPAKNEQKKEDGQ